MELQIVDIEDERSTEAEESLALIAEGFPRGDRHSIDELRLEIQEKRLGFLEPFDFHQLAALDDDGRVVAVSTGVYLAALNAGFITYLVVAESHRRRRLGIEIRGELVKRFERNAEEGGSGPLSWILGEVMIDSPWLITLVRRGNVIPFDLEYYHPDLPIDADRGRYVLYREIITDDRSEIPADEMARILYSIYRRAYREPYPMAKKNFKVMIDQIAGRETVGPNPEVMRFAAAYRS